MDIRSTIEMSSGTSIPRFGLGVFRAAGGTKDAVTWALDEGYRHVDTAHIYRNEEDVGLALKESDVPRDEVFVTTKLWNDDHGYDEALRAFDASMKALQLDVLDLWLMHWPVPNLRLESWKAMEKMLEEGRVRAIGVSNFMPHHLEELFAHAKVKPAINQIELHPFGQQRHAVQWCEKNGVVVEAYSPVTKGKRLDDPTVGAIAKEVGKTPAQVLIRWSLQKDFVVIPKSTNRDRIRENADVFDFALSEEQMKRLDGLEEGLHLAWNPTDAP